MTTYRITPDNDVPDYKVKPRPALITLCSLLTVEPSRFRWAEQPEGVDFYMKLHERLSRVTRKWYGKDPIALSDNQYLNGFEVITREGIGYHLFRSFAWNVAELECQIEDGFFRGVYDTLNRTPTSKPLPTKFVEFI